MRVLTDQEKRFCRLVAKGNDPAEAYVQVGFPGPCGSAAVERADKLRQDPEIVDAIEEYRGMEDPDEDVESVAEISRELVIKRLWKNYLAANDAGEFAAANRALELIGREMGMFEKVKKGPGAGAKSVKDMSMQDLQALMMSKNGSTRNA